MRDGFAVFFNGVADYALIFGHFGMPRLGLVGSGIASAWSFAFSFLSMVLIVCLHARASQIPHLPALYAAALGQAGRDFPAWLPIGLTMIFEAMLFNSATLIMGSFGTASVAAHQIALNVPSITFMVPLGIGMAATVRVGLAAGAGDGAGVRRAFVAAMLWRRAL